MSPEKVRARSTGEHVYARCYSPDALTPRRITVKISRHDPEAPDMSATAAIKTGNKYVIDFHSMEKSSILGKTSTGEGASFNGDRIYCGLVTKKKGTGSRAHFHPDETFNYVLKGALKVNMDGMDFVVPTGCLFHIPASMVHTAVATDEGDATYLVWRDRVAEKQGKPITTEA
jgi:quercetin dioxygenase-like cupin family protein